MLVCSASRDEWRNFIQGRGYSKPLMVFSVEKPRQCGLLTLSCSTNIVHERRDRRTVGYKNTPRSTASVLERWVAAAVRQQRQGKRVKGKVVSLSCACAAIKLITLTKASRTVAETPIEGRRDDGRDSEVRYVASCVEVRNINISFYRLYNLDSSAAHRTAVHTPDWGYAPWPYQSTSCSGSSQIQSTYGRLTLHFTATQSFPIFLFCLQLTQYGLYCV
jgi:hypothetical protein